MAKTRQRLTIGAFRVGDKLHVELDHDYVTGDAPRHARGKFRGVFRDPEGFWWLDLQQEPMVSDFVKTVLIRQIYIVEGA